MPALFPMVRLQKNNIDILSNTSHCINAVSSFRRKHHNLFTDKTNILIKHAKGKFGIFFGKSSLPFSLFLHILSPRIFNQIAEARWRSYCWNTCH